MANAQRDQNSVPTLLAVSNVDGVTPVQLYADPVTHRLLVDLPGGGGGTVTSVSVVTANGFAGSVATATTTPAITLSTTVTGILKGNGTAISAATAGTDYVTASSTNTFTNKTYDTAGSGNSFSINGTAITAVTGSGSVVLATSPTLVTPTLGVASATSINKVAITAPATSATLTIADGKTFTCNDNVTVGTAGLVLGNSGGLTVTASKVLTVNNSITVAGTDSTVMTFPSTSATIARTDAGQTFTGVQVFTSPSITTATLSGAQQLQENASIALDPAGSADGKYTGITITGTAGAALAFGDLIYLDPTDNRWELADANAASGADGDSRGILGICVLAAAGDGSATTILLNGVVRADTAFPSFTINNPIYVSETAGDVTQTQPTTTDVVIRIVGVALTADEMYFNPDQTWITHT